MYFVQLRIAGVKKLTVSSSSSKQIA